jgi:hypothetical protein
MSSGASLARLPTLDCRLSQLRAIGGVLIVALPLAACASGGPYLADGHSNMVVRTDTGERTLGAATNAWIEVQRVVVPGCRGESEGHVPLRGPTESLHLPAGRLSNLVFKFRTSSWSGVRSATDYTTLIRPREGFTYEATVTYDAGLFSVDILERAPGAPARKLPHRDIKACQRV